MKDHFNRFAVRFLTTLLLGLLALLLHPWAGNPVLGIFLPRYSAPWELSKLAYWPMLAALVLTGHLSGGAKRTLAEALPAAEREIQLLLLPEDPDAERSVVMEIRSGAGGEEAALFGALLMRMYTRYAERHGGRVEMIDANMTELGGVKEAVFSVNGAGVYSRLRYESGVHRVQRIPVTESNGKRQTSTATVAVLPEAEEVDVRIDPGDLRVDVYRASGHGGQYINKTDSAVRITHLPTGLVVTCQDEKSQLKNREKAMRVLRARLYERLQAEKDAAYDSDRRAQVGTGDRSERIRTYNFHEGRVSDHRIGMTIYAIDAFVDGDMDAIIDALIASDQQERLRRMNEATT